MRALGLLGQVELPGETASVPKARRFVRDVVDAIGHPRADDALLLVSELVANAVRFSDSARPGGRVTVAVARHDGTLHIDVIDAGSAVSRPRVHDDVGGLGCGGRGLWLVQGVATAWGWQNIRTGRVVWFQLDGNAAD